MKNILLVFLILFLTVPLLVGCGHRYNNYTAADFKAYADKPNDVFFISVVHWIRTNKNNLKGYFVIYKTVFGVCPEKHKFHFTGKIRNNHIKLNLGSFLIWDGHIKKNGNLIGYLTDNNGKSIKQNFMYVSNTKEINKKLRLMISYSNRKMAGDLNVLFKNINPNANMHSCRPILFK